jgi:hypothetical protein
MTRHLRPARREEQLTWVESGGDLLIYDAGAGAYHSLNATAVAVWKALDGRTGVRGLALRTGLAPDAVALAIHDLDEAGLLARPAGLAIERREVVRRLAAAGLLVPVIGSISAATASAQAVSCLPDCTGCPDLAPCPTGQCIRGTCVCKDFGASCTVSTECCTRFCNGTSCTNQ